MISENTMRELLAFRRERDWEQFHTPKNLAIAIAVEAGELLEQFQWSKGEAGPIDQTALRHEMADVAILLSYLAHDLKVDLDAAVRAKLALNASRYPVSTSRGTATKYQALVAGRSVTRAKEEVVKTVRTLGNAPPLPPNASRRGASTPQNLPISLPEGLRQVLEVAHLVRTTRRDRVSATAEVARRHGIEQPTVADAYTRRLGLNTTAFDMLLAEPSLSGLERLLKQKYPGFAREIVKVLVPLRR